MRREASPGTVTLETASVELRKLTATPPACDSRVPREGGGVKRREPHCLQSLVPENERMIAGARLTSNMTSGPVTSTFSLQGKFCSDKGWSTCNQRVHGTAQAHGWRHDAAKQNKKSRLTTGVQVK